MYWLESCVGGNIEKKENTNIVPSLNALSVTVKCCRKDTVGGVVIFSVTAGVVLPSSPLVSSIDCRDEN